MFVGKAGAYPVEEPFRCSTLGFALPTINKLAGRLAKDKRSSLLQIFVKYRKKFYNISPWRDLKT
jgi:hypothetical protein